MRYVILPILSSLFVSLLAVLAGTSLFPAEPYSDPFEPYNPIMPGQPASALDQFPCSITIMDEYLPDSWTYCEIHPASGPIRLVMVTSREDLIMAVGFQVEGLQVGHIVQRWGHPDRLKRGRRYYTLSWDEGIRTSFDNANWFTYQSSLDLVSFRYVKPTTT